MYTGAFYGTGGYHQYLVRTELSSPHNSVEVAVQGDYNNEEAIGMDVDEDTGYVYVTTDDYDFRVYDPNLTLLDTEENDGIYSAAGVAVGGWYKTPSFALVKDNNDPNNECVRPFIGMGLEDNYLDFDICWDANGHADTNSALIDYLPKECDYYSSTPSGDYNSTDHTVTWNLGDIGENDANCFELKTKVNYWARPGGSFTNLVVMEGDTYLNEATEDCNICAWGSEIIYVDEDANGYNNGTSWDNAYNYLQDAFTGARNCGASVTAIWVAAGTYKPVWDTGSDSSYKDETFELIEDVGLFGHFGGVGIYETSTSQRDFADANNETILEGKIGTSTSEAVKYIVKAEDIEDAIVDGFTIRGSYNGAGIYLDDADVAVVNCKLKDNHDYGVYAADSFPDIHNCTFSSNDSRYSLKSIDSRPELSDCIFDGKNATLGAIYCERSDIKVTDSTLKNHSYDSVVTKVTDIELQNCTFQNNSFALWFTDSSNPVINHCLIEATSDSGTAYDTGIWCDAYSTLELTNSVIRRNGSHGIYLEQMRTTVIKNNWIHDNGIDNNASGIYLKDQISQPLIRNNTIYNNSTYGIESSEHGAGADPNVLNCIIYGNDSNDLYRENEDFENVNYCCLQNAHSGTGNITGDPGFKNPTDPNDLHIDETSQCKDAGDPNGSYGDETDIDGEARIKYGHVDMGADEYYWSPADFDESGNVNFADYAIFAAAWLTDSGDPNYNETCDLADNNSIDFNDLALFCEDWLWEKAWDEGWMMCMGAGGMGLGIGAGSGLETTSLESTYTLKNPKTTSTNRSDDLMLPSAMESLKARPERLTAKSQKFYDITPETTISAKQKALDAQRINIKANIKDLLNWLDETWLSGELKEVITEDEYLEFRKAIEESLR